MRILFLSLLSFVSYLCFSQTIDVQHYRFQLQLSDENDRINGRAIITISFPQATKDFSLDFAQTKGNGKGMKVEEVKGKNVNSFLQQNDQLHIQLKSASTKATDTFE